MFQVQPSIIPPNERQRMAAVTRYNVLDTPPDGAFDRVTALAARRFKVPIAIVSIVDHDRIWFKSHHGIAATQIDREPGLCASAILSSDPYIIEDARKDVRSLANPLVAGDFGLRFYAGVPLRTHDGYNLGTLCVIDKEARAVDQAQVDDLRDLASLVVDQMELRLSARSELERAAKATEQATLMGKEIEHRVANSLQFVSSVLSLQGKQAPDGTALHLETAAQRVAAVARVHRHLLNNEDVAYISVHSYMVRLAEDLSGLLNTQIKVHGDDSKLNTKSLQTIGLLINELVTNSAKHGAGPVMLAFKADAHQCTLTVCDGGAGLPQNFSVGTSRGLGMKIIDVLAKQLGGTVSAAPPASGRGACFTVTFPRKPELIAV